MGAVRQAHRGRGAGDFLDGNAVFEIAKTQAAKFLFHGDAVQTECAHLGPEVDGKRIGLVDLGGTRRDLVAGETVGGLADGIGHVAEGEIEMGHCGLLSSMSASR